LRFSGLILGNIFMVFLGCSCRETAKNAIKKIRWEKTKGKKFFFSQLFRPKVFDIDFPQKVFYGVAELPLLRNAQKRHKQIKKIKKKQKGTYLIYWPSAGYTPVSFFFFLNAPCTCTGAGAGAGAGAGSRQVAGATTGPEVPGAGPGSRARKQGCGGCNFETVCICMRMTQRMCVLCVITRTMCKF
jgi:hypothetical protein